MKTIAAILTAGALAPAKPIPSNAVLVTCDGANYTVYEPGDQLPAAAPATTVPSEVTMRQARLALNATGKLAAVQTAITAMAEPAKTNTQIWWDYSSTVQRYQPLVVQLGTAIGLTSTDLDNLFKTAITL